MDRIAKAYVRSATAFARYATESSAAYSTDLWCHHPDSEHLCGRKFASDAPDAPLLHRELLQAARDQVHAGATSRHGPNLEVAPEAAVVRLASLAVASHMDRQADGLGDPKRNGVRRGRCFGNDERQEEKTGEASEAQPKVERKSTQKLCHDIAMTYRAWLEKEAVEKRTIQQPADTLRSKARRHREPYQNTALLSPRFACSGKEYAVSSDPSNDTYKTSQALSYTDSQSTVDDFLDQCYLQHRLGMIDQEWLFGLPDFARFPLLDEARKEVRDVRGRYSELLTDYFYDRMILLASANATEGSADLRRLFLYTAAELCISLWWYVPAICVLAFWVYSSFVEMIGRAQAIRSGEEDADVDGFPPSFTRIVAWGTSIAVVVWVWEIHPWPTVTAPRYDPSCDDHRRWGSVHGLANMSEAAVAWQTGLVLVVILVGEFVIRLFVMILFKWVKPDERGTLGKIYFSPQPFGLAIRVFTQTLVLGTVAALIFIVSNLLRRHVDNFYYTVQRHDLSYVGTTTTDGGGTGTDMLLGTRISSTTLLIFGLAFIGAVLSTSASQVGMLPTNPKTGVLEPSWRTVLWVGLTVLVAFLWLLLFGPVEHHYLTGADGVWPVLDVRDERNQFARVPLTEQDRTIYGADNIVEVDLNYEGHRDKFVDSFGRWVDPYFGVWVAVLSAYVIAMLLACCASTKTEKTAFAQNLQAVRDAAVLGAGASVLDNNAVSVSNAPFAPSRRPYGKQIGVQASAVATSEDAGLNHGVQMPLLALDPALSAHPPLRRSRRVPAHPGGRL
tara:strand:+ start:155 stop:2509 length:2355 start_codon:yes stop_codon:yes gene_type:complete